MGEPPANRVPNASNAHLRDVLMRAKNVLEDARRAQSEAARSQTTRRSYEELVATLAAAQMNVENGVAVDPAPFEGLVRGVADWLPIVDSRVLKALDHVERALASLAAEREKANGTAVTHTYKKKRRGR